MTSTDHKTSPISIIIPTRNEATNIGATIECAKHHNVLEIIVADANSSDNTSEIASQLGATVIDAPLGRAQQMNAGAAIAKGEVLLFLHADTLLPADFAKQIATVLAQPGIVAGAFGLAIDLPGVAIRLLQEGIRFRSTFLQLPYGDQAIFLNRQNFIEIGGYPAEPILEDVLLIKRLRKSGRIGIASSNVLTSGRRWQRLGLIQTTLINQCVMLGHLLGVPPKRLQSWYGITQKI